MRLPHACGEHVLWQVAAVAGPAQSRLSARSSDNDYGLPDCHAFAVVTFANLDFPADSKVDMWYSIFANNIEKRYWSDTIRMPLTGGIYPFSSLSTYYDFPPYNIPSTDSIVVPLSSDPAPALRYGCLFRYWSWQFGDWEPSLCRLWCDHTIAMTPEKWATFNETVSCPLLGAQCLSGPAFRYSPSVTVNVRGFVTSLP